MTSITWFKKIWKKSQNWLVKKNTIKCGLNFFYPNNKTIGVKYQNKTIESNFTWMKVLNSIKFRGGKLK